MGSLPAHPSLAVWLIRVFLGSLILLGIFGGVMAALGFILCKIS